MTTTYAVVTNDFSTMDDGALAAAVSTLAAHIHILLCPTHHRLVHEGGFDVQRLDDGAFRFVNPHGLAIKPPRRQATSSPDTIIVQNESLGLAIDCETATAHWHGGAHRLRPCADGDDGVVGFGRHRSGGGTGGRRLEPVVGADRRQHFDLSQVYLRVRALGCSKTSFVAEGTSLKPSRNCG